MSEKSFGESGRLPDSEDFHKVGEMTMDARHEVTAYTSRRRRKKRWRSAVMALAAVVALCMFFSGTIKTISTAKVKLVTAKQGKLEEVIRHSVELGVTEIVPFFSRYCVATPKKEDAKNERYNRIAAEAAKQAGRAMLPHVSMPLLNFAAVCDALQEDYDLALFFYEGGGAPLRTVLRPGCAKKIAIVTGSEGGFSVEEAEAAKAAGAVTVGLGPRILRCETAPLTALTAAMLLTGNLE